VERFHRNLKEALKARGDSPDWFQALPWVLLGIRTAPKEDLNCSSAEMLYGMPLTVPGDFILNPNQEPNHKAAIREMREQAAQLAPVPTAKHGTPISSFPPTLKKAKFVFVRKDKHCPPLCRPYEGPFEVLEPGGKFFKISRHGKTDIISVDRLKPAHLDTTALPSLPDTSTTSTPLHTPVKTNPSTVIHPPCPTPPPRTQPYVNRYGRIIKPTSKILEGAV
jgi:hypothetical protein